ncbi:MAG: HAMP domain-containing histidine kinase [Campylobacterales bacterium]|nr:HAMP domain-containing histidine kinase [Campylobacterales bacterium]
MQQTKDLVIAYECINAIGNALELKAMLLEVLMAFGTQSGALGAAYFEAKEGEYRLLVKVGSYEAFQPELGREALERAYGVTTLDSLYQLSLAVQNDLLLLVYDASRAHIDRIGTMFAGFRRKLMISVNACRGVEQIQELNEQLEERVQTSVRLMREQEKMLIGQSKLATMGEMMSMIAHQWRQPITTIGMVANNLIFDLQMSEMRSDDMIKELEVIDAQVHHLAKTIDDFRNFFRPDKEKESFTLQEVIDDTLKILLRSFDNNGIAIMIEGNGGYTLRSYKNEMIQVLLNLFGNAKDALLEAKSPNPCVTVRFDEDEERIIIAVCDNGPGVDEGIADRIFEPYFSTKSEQNGTGLGLYMSNAIVQKHIGGTLDFINTYPGVCFRVLIDKKSSGAAHEI